MIKHEAPPIHRNRGQTFMSSRRKPPPPPARYSRGRRELAGDAVELNDILRYTGITTGGARSLGLDVGTLAPDRPADLCAVRLDHPAMAGARPDALLATLIFGATSAAKVALPVTLPPGRLRLATSPNATGSLPVKQTIGMVVVAAFAGTAAVAPAATITATWRRTRSAASAGSRSTRFTA